jgi:hypothetical protein
VSEDEWMDEQSEAVQKAITKIGDEAGTLDADPQVLIAAGKAIEQLERDKAALESDLFEIRSLIRPIMDNSTAIFEHSVGIKAKHPPSTD